MIGLADIEAARQRIDDVIRPTPVVDALNLSQLIGREVLLKPEYRQRTGSFKIRGATNFLARIDPVPEAVVAASAGNHAQGVALAATQRGVIATIFMPDHTPLPKVEATRSYGAQVRFGGPVVDDCFAAARAFADETGATYVPPFDHPDVVAGQGTIGLELADEAPDAEVVLVPVGGGGLIAGIATALAHVRPGVRVVGVEPESAAAMRASLDAGRVTTIDAPATMADGIAVRAPSELTLAHVRAYVDDVVTVSEESLSRAVLLLLERAKAVVEPAGAAPLAALLDGAVGGVGPAVCVLSGGNVDPLLLTKLIDHGLSAAGRYLTVRLHLVDQPGALAALLTRVAMEGLNVLSVEHFRTGLDLPVDMVEVRLTLETRDPEHRDEVIATLGTVGYDAELLH